MNETIFGTDYMIGVERPNNKIENISLEIENEYWEWYNDLEASVLSFMYRPADYSDDGGHYDYRYRGC